MRDELSKLSQVICVATLASTSSRHPTKSIMQTSSAPHGMTWAPSHPRRWSIQLDGGMLGRGRRHFGGETPWTTSGLFCWRHPHESSLWHHVWDVRRPRRKPQCPPSPLPYESRGGTRHTSRASDLLWDRCPSGAAHRLSAPGRHGGAGDHRRPRLCDH
jgi:hypothetical protein